MLCFFLGEKTGIYHRHPEVPYLFFITRGGIAGLLRSVGRDPFHYGHDPAHGGFQG